MASLAMLSILLRLLSRYAVGRTIYLDDYAMILNLVRLYAATAGLSWTDDVRCLLLRFPHVARGVILPSALYL